MKFRGVKRFRQDCEKLANFVRKIEAFITETEDETDMTGPGWQAAFSALHESLLEVANVFDDCGRYGMIRSMMNADDLNMRLNAIAQRLNLALQLIPIQKAKENTKRLANLEEIQKEIRAATFAAVTAAEQQSADLKRLMDQSRKDASKTQEMLEQVLRLLQSDSGDASVTTGSSLLGVDRSLLEGEVADLQEDLGRAKHDKRHVEEQYLAQIIAAITAMEPELVAPGVEDAPPPDLCCPITQQVMVDPVMLVESSQTYERAAIQEWLDRGNLRDPVTGVDISTSLLVPNVLVRKFVHEWLQKQQQPAADKARVGDQANSSGCAAPIAVPVHPGSAAGADSSSARHASFDSVHHDALSAAIRPFQSYLSNDTASVCSSISGQRPEAGFAGLHQQQQRTHQPQQDGSQPLAAGASGSFGGLSAAAGTCSAAGQTKGAAAGGLQGAFHLDELHAALGKIGETQYKMALRHGDARTAETVLQLQQSAQQSRQQQVDRAYLQQHMERLSQQLALAPEINPRRLSVSTSSDAGWLKGAAAAAGQAAPGPPSEYAPSEPGSSILLQAPLAHYYSCPDVVGQDDPPASVASDLGRRSDLAAMIHASSSMPPRPPVDRQGSAHAHAAASHVSSSTATVPATSLSAELSKRGRPEGRPANKDIDRISVDQLSVDSKGSKGSSKRSFGSGLVTKLKSISYSMVWDEDKC